MLAMLRPHLFSDVGLPLRLFGYPAPAELLAVDMHPQSGSGPDNSRTNLLEALCAHWATMVHDSGAFTVLTQLQDVWHLMRLRVDFFLRSQPQSGPVSAHQVVAAAMELSADVLS